MQLDYRARRIRSLQSRARGAIKEIGKELIAAKSEMEHGEWLPWRKDNFGWSERSAQNYMNVAVAFRSRKSETVADLDSLAIDARALYFLASKSVPEEVRTEALELAKTQPVSLADAKKLCTQESEPEIDNNLEANVVECVQHIVEDIDFSKFDGDVIKALHEIADKIHELATAIATASRSCAGRR